MNNDLLQFQQLQKAFTSGPAAGERAWSGLQRLAENGFRPAQMFVALQKLKSPAPLFDLQGGLELLQALVTTTVDDQKLRTSAYYWLGETLMCHYPKRLSDGLGYLKQAAEMGNVDAQMNLAYCLRRGVATEPDLAGATHWLKLATQQGHPRAWFELGMVLALPDHADHDGKQAMLALKRAESFHYPAAAGMAEQLAQVGNIPQSRAVQGHLHSKPDIECISGLLDRMECSHLAGLAMPHLKPSRVISDQQSGKATHGRSSEGMNFHPGLRDIVVTNVIRRLCELANCAESQAEALTVLMYIPGGQYRVHPDYFPTESAAGSRQLENGGQRIKTLVCYLNEVGAGGETEFPYLDLKIKPEPGCVVLFENADSNGLPYLDSRHAGLPVTAGSKWISTLWLRQTDHDQWY